MSQRLSLSATALLVLTIATGAQGEAVQRGRITPLKHVTYDWGGQKVVRHGAPEERFRSVFCYVNTDTSGFFLLTTYGTEFSDWGILGGTASTKCDGLSDVVSSFRFAYATSTLDTSVAGPGAALTVAFYTSWSGFCANSGNSPVATFSFTGMPGSSGGSTGIGAYAFHVDVSGGFEFCMPDGRFGYGYRGDGKTGPILCYDSDGIGGPEPCTGNEEGFEIWAPDTQGVCLGSFFFQMNGVTSWYGQIARASLSGSPAAVALRNGAPNAPGSLVCTAPRIAGTCTLTAADPAGHTTAIAFAFDTPVDVLLSGGQRLLCLDVGGNGELLTGAGLALTPTGSATWTSGALPVPKNLELYGFTLSVQAIFAFGVVPFSLSSACDLTIGG